MIDLRRATLDDLALLVHWQSKPHVIEAIGSDEPWDWTDELTSDVPWREYFIALDDEQPIGFVGIIDPHEEESHYWGDVEPHLRAIDIWIGEESDLGQGHGSEMMRLAISRCFSDPRVEAILIDPLSSNVRAQRFYARLGFVPVGQRWFDEDDCLVMRLDRPAAGYS